MQKFGGMFLLILPIFLLPITALSEDRNANDCSKQAISETKLFSYIQSKNPQYRADDRPRRNSNAPVLVNVSLHLTGIKDLIEHEGTLVVDGYFRVAWSDEILRWDNYKFPYWCVPYLIFSTRQVWRPDFLIQSDSFQQMQEQIASDARVTIYNDGTAEFFPQGRMAVNCELDLTLFPFDTQLCTIYVNAWTYDASMQELILEDDGPAFYKVKSFWFENRQWEIVANRSEATFLKYVGDNSSYPRLAFTLLLRRKPLFYCVNIILPIVIIGAVEVVVFVLPSVDVTKISISVTCLLAYSVFQNMIIDDMPRSGSSVPLLSLYIDLQMAYISLIAILGSGLAFFISIEASQQQVRPPRWLMRAIRVLGTMVSFAGPHTILQAWKQCYSVRALASFSCHLTCTVSLPRKALKEAPEQSSINQQWTFAAQVIERLTFLIYLGAVVLTPIVMFAILPQYITKSESYTLSE